jgi:hypothetical protein
MSGYMWARTPEGALFVVLVADGKGYVPGVENAIDPSDFFFWSPSRGRQHPHRKAKIRPRRNLGGLPPLQLSGQIYFPSSRTVDRVAGLQRRVGARGAAVLGPVAAGL